MKDKSKITMLEEALKNGSWRVAGDRKRLKMGNNISVDENGRHRSDIEKNDRRKIKAMQACGLIEDWDCEVFIPLMIHNAQGEPLKVGTYKADNVFYFRNKDNARVYCIWETKGYETEIYKLKKKIVLHLYKGTHFYESKFTGVTLLNAPESENFLNIIKERKRK